MQIQSSIDEFITKINKCAKNLETFSIDIKNRESKILDLLEITEKNIRIENLDFSNRKSDLKNLCVENKKKILETIQSWTEIIKQNIEGKEFINKFEKSLLVIVFGNVNTGKSTFGNFIAGVPFLKSDFKYSDKTEFYVYDWSKNDNKIIGEKKLDINSFKTDCVEATASIQYFTLNNGLTWVDTPGIHSLTTENEALAKQYSNYADLILFLVPSSAPVKADEIKEIKSLIGKGKSLLIAITKSDEVKPYIEDGIKKFKTLPKTDGNRKAQEDYVSRCIDNMDFSKQIVDKQYISVSIQLAEEAIIQKDYNNLVESNIISFWNQIGRIMESDAIELKKARPKNEINSIIAEIIEGSNDTDSKTSGIKDIRAFVEDIKQELDKKRDEISNINDSLFSEVKGNLYNRLESKVFALSREFDMGNKINNSDIVSIIEKEVIDEFSKTIPKKINKILNDFEYNGTNSLTLNIKAEFVSKTIEIKTPILEVVTRKRDPKNLIEWVGHIVFDKEFTEKRVESTEETREVKVGNNFVELIDSIILQIEPQIEAHLENIVSDAVQNYFDPMESMIGKIIFEMDILEEQLRKLKF